MPGSVRKPDLDSAGYSNATSSPNTYVNNLQMTRYSDQRTPGYHDCGKTISGAEVFCNNRHCQYIGHPTTAPTTQVQGSPNVIIN